MTFEPRRLSTFTAAVHFLVMYSLIQGITRLEHIKQHQLMKSLRRVLKRYTPSIHSRYDED